MDQFHGFRVPFWIRVKSGIINFVTALARNKDGTINRRLAEFFEHSVPANAKPEKGVWTRDVTIDPESKTWARLFVPVAAASTDQTSGRRFPVVMYYHGGGFCFLTPGSKRYDRFCRRITREFQVIVVSVHYRRAPECKFPVAYDDSFQALKWLQDNSPMYLPPSADLGNCFLMGDCAGGNIAHHVAVQAAEMADDLKPLCICGLIMLQPLFGGQVRTRAELVLENPPMISVVDTDWYWKAFLPEDATRDHPACNVFGPNGKDISGVNLPPSFIAFAGWDILLDWNISYAQSLRKAGKDIRVAGYGPVGHCFFLIDDGHWTTLLLRDVFNFILLCQNL